MIRFSKRLLFLTEKQFVSNVMVAGVFYFVEVGVFGFFKFDFIEYYSYQKVIVHKMYR